MIHQQCCRSPLRYRQPTVGRCCLLLLPLWWRVSGISVAVHVEAISSVGLGIRGICGADVMLAKWPVWISGGPDVNQMG